MLIIKFFFTRFLCLIYEFNIKYFMKCTDNMFLFLLFNVIPENTRLFRLEERITFNVKLTHSPVPQNLFLFLLYIPKEERGVVG